MPVLQFSKAEYAYALHRAMFQSPSLGVSGMREANKISDHIKSLSSVLPLVHNKGVAGGGGGSGGSDEPPSVLTVAMTSLQFL